MTKTKNRYYNPNPRKHEVGDCVIRAFCKATGEYWETIYKELCELGLEIYDLPNGTVTWKEWLERRDDFIEHSISVKKGQKRPTVDSFTRKHKEGTYILRVANHLVTVEGGYYYDTWDCGDKAVYKYWEKV